MRTRATITASGLALLALTSCASQTTSETADHRPPTAATSAATTGTTGSVDLIIPGATTAQAQAAIRAYARNIRGPELYYLKVQHSRDATRYVCRARWYADADSYRAHAGPGTTAPGTWPYLALNCP
ncbi:hypothetical protein [Streptomyces sp. SID13726]|uniref:hypothetical protein n=1 Tax=Streptomyces sp. SID13726 TaxID=2706058 RepID=UPI0013B9E665|nr:hypothetical protein [Streptomyces sp. SID13726]NEB00610.1 hypothetical protein [Streptomyces sp. SID13726]